MQTKRMGSISVVVLLFCLWPAGLWAQVHHPGKLTIAEYNAEWMLDVFDDPYTIDEQFPPKPRNELAQIAAALKALDADVVTVEEIENEGFLKAFVAEMLPDAGYQYVAVQATNSERGQNLGVLSRVPIVSLTSHRFQDLKLDAAPGKTWRYARDLMQVKLQVTPKHTLDLFVVHLKSKHDSDSDPKSGTWRLAEATAARKLIDQMLAADPKAWIVFAGDCNDTPGTPPVRALLAPADGKPASLADVHAGLPAQLRITYRKPPFRDVGPIDYLLASPDMARHLVPGSAKVLDDEKVLGGSDHAPIVATFETDGE